MRYRRIYNWYDVDSFRYDLDKETYGEPKLHEYEWNQLLEAGLIGGRNSRPSDFFKLQTLADAVELNLFASWMTYQHFTQRKALQSQFRTVYEALHNRFGDVANEIELYLLFRKQSKLRMNKKKYVSTLASTTQALKDIKISVEMREKYITAVTSPEYGMTLCTQWCDRIRTNETLWDYVEKGNYADTVLDHSRQVDKILGQNIYDAMNSAYKTYQEALRNDQAYERGDDEEYTRKYFQCSLPSEFHSKKVFTLTGVYKADEIRAYYKSNKGAK
jgi:hypothetical protein